MLYLGIVIAGGSGALLRYLLGRATVNMGWAGPPFGTLIANLLGCFLIGYLSWALIHKWPTSAAMQTVVITGFLGGFTTFSAFSLATVNMIEQGTNWQAFFYVLVKVVLCITMSFAGLMLARQT